MMNQDIEELRSASVGRHAKGFGLSFLLASAFSALLVLLKESVAPIKDAMKAALGHHWVTHGVLVLLLFAVIGVVLSKGKLQRTSASTLLAAVIGGTVISGLILLVFFLGHI